MSTIDKMATDGTFDNLSKRERLQISRKRAKLEKNLGSITDLTRLPAALFIIDVSKEHIAVREAKRLSIPLFGMVDTNSDPKNIDFPIPSNDDASNSIALILDTAIAAITAGLEERKFDKEKEVSQTKEKPLRKAKNDENDEFSNEEDVIDEDTVETVEASAEGNAAITDAPKKSPAKRTTIKKNIKE